MLPSNRFWRWLFGAAMVLSGIFAGLVLLDLVPLIRGPEAWRWWLLPLPSLGKVILTGITVLLFVVVWWVLGRRLSGNPNRKRRWTSLVVLAIVVFIVQLAFLSIYRTNPFTILFERLASDQASGYFTVAAEIDHLPTFLKAYPELMPQFRPDPHPRSKPPGIVLLYWGATRVLEKTPALSGALGHWARNIRCGDLWLVSQSDAALAGNVVVGLLTMITSILIIWPAYGLAARRWGSQAGWLAAGLAALMPGRLLFAPHLDTIYPFLALLALYFADSGIRRDKIWLTAVSGIILSLATFFSLVNILAAGVIGLFVLLSFLPDRRWKSFIRHGLVLVGGVLFIWLIYWLYARVSPFDIYLASRPARHDLARSYWLWLFGNIYDFAVFGGLPVFLTAVIWTSSQLNKRKFRPLALAFWAGFILVDISGVIRAEVGRIWLMLASFPVVLAAQVTDDRDGPHLPSRTDLLLLALTALSLWAMSLRWEVTRLEWPPPTDRAVEIELPDRPLLNIPFGPEISLAAYDIQVDEQLVTTLYWQAVSRPDIPYTVFVHIVDEAGNILLQQDTMPQNGRLPTTCWQSSEIVVDRHELDLTSLEPGSYQIVVGLYQQDSAVRLGETVLKPALIVGQ